MTAPKPRAIPLKIGDLWPLLICTLRYSMGRQSYVTAQTCDLIRDYARHLKAWQLAQIAAEIRTAIAESHRLYNTTLGMRMDEDGWVRLAEEIENGLLAGAREGKP